MFRTRAKRETASRPTARRGSVGSAAVWDAERRAGHGQSTEGPRLPAASRFSADELAALVSGIVQVTLDTRMPDSTRARRAELGRELEERLLGLLGVTPNAPPRHGQEHSTLAAPETPITPTPRVSPEPTNEVCATGPSARALELVLEERLSRLGGTVAARSDLRQRLIELAVSANASAGQTSEASSEELRLLDVMQRRAAKVERSLHDARAVLAYVSGLEHVDTGVSSIYRTVQGLSALDPERARKQGVLEAVFQANLRLQKVDASGPGQSENSTPK